jgi:hypothetical protein
VAAPISRTGGLSVFGATMQGGRAWVAEDLVGGRATQDEIVD